MRVLEALPPEALHFAESVLKLSFPGGTTGLTSLTDDGRIAGGGSFHPDLQREQQPAHCGCGKALVHAGVLPQDVFSRFYHAPLSAFDGLD